MSFNLMESVSGLFTNDLVNQASSVLGESGGGISKALGGILPSVLLGTLNKAQEPGGADGLFSMAQQAAGSGLLGNLGSILSGGGGSIVSTLVSGLLGGKSGAIANVISQFAGVKSSTASSLIGMAVPAVLGFLGKRSADQGLNASGLLSLLTGQKDNILQAVPSGLSLSSLGFGNLASSASSAVHETRRMAEQASDAGRSGLNKWLLPLLLALLGFALIFYLAKGCGKRGEEAVATVSETVDSAAAKVEDAATDVIQTVRESFKVSLPGGVELDAYKGGIEDMLVRFLNDPNSQVGKDVWFDFDDLNFETGSARITTESQKQINNLVAILKAYPKLKIKIGGYTDKTGDEAANMKLSQDRAAAVAAALKTAGADAGQIVGAEGYGSQFATVPAEASDEERRKDRRISVSVREK